MAEGREREFFKAIFYGDGKRVGELLALGVSPEARDEEGSTALYEAVGNAWVVGVLLAAGAPPDELSGGEGEGTALCRAACFGEEDSLRTLLRGGADPNVAESDGYTPLIWAVQGGWHACANRLLVAGADPDAADTFGNTPLHGAAERGSQRITRLLLEYGARSDVRNAAGQTPADLARSWVGKDVEAELRRTLLEFPWVPAASFAEVRHTVVVEAKNAEGRGMGGHERECGHREIVELLEPGT